MIFSKILIITGVAVSHIGMIVVLVVNLLFHKKNEEYRNKVLNKLLFIPLLGYFSFSVGFIINSLLQAMQNV